MLRADAHRAVTQALAGLSARTGHPPNELGAAFEAATTFEEGLVGVAQALDDPSAGAQLGFSCPLGAFGIIDYIGSSAATPDAAWAAVSTYLDAVANTVRYHHRRPWIEPRAAGALSGDFLAALLVPRARAALDIEPVDTLRLSTTEVPEWMADALGPIRLVAGVAGLRLRDEALDRPLTTADPRLHEVLCGSAEAMGYGRVDRPLGERVDLLVDAVLPAGRPTLDDLAMLLHVSKRTLRRQLAAEGTSYQALMDRLLARRAESLLSRGSPVKEVAFELGYGSASAFSRAFKRWTGRAPVDHLATSPGDAE